VHRAEGRGAIKTSGAGTALTYFPDAFPHNRAEADEWLNDYLRLVIRIHEERRQQKKDAGAVDRESIYDSGTLAELAEEDKMNESQAAGAMPQEPLSS